MRSHETQESIPQEGRLGKTQWRLLAGPGRLTLEEELSKLQNNEANIEFPVEFTNSIIQDISSEINKCLQYYEKNIIERLDKIKENISKKSPKIINDEFNKILNVIKDNNDKLFDDFSKKQMEIKEKINQMAKDLNIKIEKNNENEKKLHYKI